MADEVLDALLTQFMNDIRDEKVDEVTASLEVFKGQLGKSFEVTMRDGSKREFTPVGLAAYVGSPEIMTAFLTGGSVQGNKDSNGFNPLLAAIDGQAATAAAGGKPDPHNPVIQMLVADGFTLTEADMKLLRTNMEKTIPQDKQEAYLEALRAVPFDHLGMPYDEKEFLTSLADGINAKQPLTKDEAKSNGETLLDYEKLLVAAGLPHPEYKIEGAASGLENGQAYILEAKELSAFLQARADNTALTVAQWVKDKNIGLTSEQNPDTVPGGNADLAIAGETIKIEAHNQHRTYGNGGVSDKPVAGYYGDIKGVKAGDGDELDAYVAEAAAKPDAQFKIFLFQQQNRAKDGKLTPDKLKVGFAEDAKSFRNVMVSAFADETAFMSIMEHESPEYIELTPEQFTSLKQMMAKNPSLTLAEFVQAELQKGTTVPLLNDEALGITEEAKSRLADARAGKKPAAEKPAEVAPDAAAPARVETKPEPSKPSTQEDEAAAKLRNEIEESAKKGKGTLALGLAGVVGLVVVAVAGLFTNSWLGSLLIGGLLAVGAYFAANHYGDKFLEKGLNMLGKGKDGPQKEPEREQQVAKDTPPMVVTPELSVAETDLKKLSALAKTDLPALPSDLLAKNDKDGSRTLDKQETTQLVAEFLSQQGKKGEDVSKPLTALSEGDFAAQFPSGIPVAQKTTTGPAK